MKLNNRILLCSFFVILLSSCSTIAKKEITVPEIQLAKNYYKALYDKKYDEVKKIASSKSFRFSDPTVQKEVANLPTEKNSLEEFLKYMKESSENLIEPSITFEDSFYSNNNVVLYVNFKGSVPAKMFGKSSGTLKFSSRGISIIEIKDGLVVGHIDYMDYSMLNELIKAQL